MFHFNFHFTPISMVPTYKQEYQLGWINKNTVAQYVAEDIITKADYEGIVGEPLDETPAS